MRYRFANILQRTALTITALLLLSVHGPGVFDGPAEEKFLRSAATTTILDSNVKAKEVGPAARASVAKSYGNLPLSFETNNGQVDDAVKYLSRGSGYRLFLTSTEAVLSLRHGSLAEKPDLAYKSPKAHESKPTVSNVFHLKPIAANPNPRVTGLDELPGKSNYFIGNDPAKWRTSISNYAKVKMQDVYPGIDLVYYGNQRQMEYDWIVAPGADPKAIKFTLEGKANLKVDARGDLILDEKGELRLNKPIIYQRRAGTRTEIAGRYALLGKHEVGFQLDKYDASLPLVIDPVLSYSTYLGGGGEDDGYGIAVDSSGNAYVIGDTWSASFPTANPFQASFGGSRDVFVTKLNASGSALVYSTYLGGNDEEWGDGIAIDSSRNALVTGGTYSANFPTANAFQSAFQGGTCDAFVTKLNASGNALLYSTYLGGSGSDGGAGIAVDSLGNAYVTGDTSSTNFPTANPFQPSLGSGSYTDAFVTKLNASGNSLIYSTYLGGNNQDIGHAIAVDSSGNAYVTGAAFSTDFPTANPFQPSLGSGSYTDAFVTKLNASGNSLIYSTYLGGSGYEDGWGIAVDSSGNAYVTGVTYSANFPTANPFQPSLGGNRDAFVTKLNASGNSLIYSTYLGGSVDDGGLDIAVDSSGNAYVIGDTWSANFPTANPFQASFGGGNYDAFVTKLNASGNALVYSTYLGGSGRDDGYGIAVDSSGNAYVTGDTNSTNFPTANPFQPSFGGGNYDAFVTKMRTSVSSVNISLSAGGGAAVKTVGSNGATQPGYATLAVNSGAAPYGTAVFSFKQNGVTVAKAGIPASPPTTLARVFIDWRSSVLSIPGQPNSGTININTGIAVVNTGTATANVTYTLRNAAGTTLTTGNGTIAAGAHFAKFIDQLADVAPDFRLPANFQSAIQFASLEIAGNRPLSVLALRGTNNQRNDFLITTTPIADLTQSLNNSPIYFPQFVDGGGYTTSLVLLNTSGAVQSGLLEMLDDNGAPLSVQPVGGTARSSFPYSILPNGAFRLQTDGAPADFKKGWVRLIPDPGTSTPIGSGIFAYNPEDMLLSEPGIPSAMSTTHARIFADLSGSHNTGLAIANIMGSNADIVINAFEMDGITPIGSSQGPWPLAAYGHDAKFVDQFIAGLPSGFRGVLDIRSTTPFAALTIRSLLNERRDFLMTTFPIADANAAAPSPIVFPQVVDGGGYVTQFIFLSPSGASNATLSFWDETGAPLAIGQ